LEGVGRAPCPFCWSRRALETWEATDHALFASPEALRAAAANAGERLNASPFDLILWSTSNAFPRRRTDDETGNDEDTLPRALRREIDRRGGWCQLAATEIGVLGGLYLSTITPDGPAWRGSTSRLLIIPPGVEPHAKWSRPTANGSKSMVRTYRRPTRKVVLGAVARACRYPKTWMTGEPKDIVAILDARANLKLSASFGLLRNRSARAREAAAANRPGR
jgi:hypothetical protein